MQVERGRQVGEAPATEPEEAGEIDRAIAALADRHLCVSKVVYEGCTRTQVDELTGEARVEEVADMIAGGADEKTARAEARRLLTPEKRRS